MDIRRTVAQIIGGSSGLGLVTAEALLAGGGKVAIVDPTAFSVEGLPRRTRRLRGIAEMDVRDEGEASIRPLGRVVAMTLPLARYLSGLGIRVNAIAPGLFATPPPRRCQGRRAVLDSKVWRPSRLGIPSEFATLVIHIVENTTLYGETVR